MDEQISNVIDYTEELVTQFADYTGLCLKSDGWETAILDMVADLLHVAHRKECDVSRIVEMAQFHFEVELEEGGR